MTAKYTSQTPFTASYMLFKNTAGKFAFLLRSNTTWMNGYYTFPSGKVENGEFYTDCAIRESKEEVGASILPKDLRTVLTMHRIEVDSTWVDVYLEVLSWEGELYNAEPDIHGGLVWFSPDELPDNIVPNVRHALEQIATGNTYCEFKGEN